MDQLMSTLRVVQNIAVLLNEGFFIGAHAKVVPESQQFIAKLAEDLQASIAAQEKQVEQEAGCSPGRKENSSRVGSGGVSNRRRKDRKAKAD